MAIRRTNPFSASRLHLQDWFHLFVNWNTSTLILLLILLYTAILFIFAGLFYWADSACGTELASFREAFVLSAITVSTIGYGTTDPYFNDCLAAPVILVAVTIIGLFLDSLFIGLLFTRFSRGTTRARTVVFSDKAVIRAIRGQWYLMVQVTELHRHPLLEAHIRLYAIQHHSVGSPEDKNRVYFQTNTLRLQQPNVSMLC
jgi:potassium inwardly-rectifying channel subfamily J protein 9